MNWETIQKKLADHAWLEKGAGGISRQAENMRDAVRLSDDACLKDLRRVVQRRANQAARMLSRSWVVDVRVTPLVNHINYTARAYVKLRWACRGGEFTLRACVDSDRAVETLLMRLRRTIIINRDPEDVKHLKTKNAA